MHSAQHGEPHQNSKFINRNCIHTHMQTQTNPLIALKTCRDTPGLIRSHAALLSFSTPSTFISSVSHEPASAACLPPNLTTVLPNCWDNAIQRTKPKLDHCPQQRWAEMQSSVTAAFIFLAQMSLRVAHDDVLYFYHTWLEYGVFMSVCVCVCVFVCVCVCVQAGMSCTCAQL